MKAKDGDDQDARTFTQQARRAQIVQAAIETVAEVGYPNTSFSKIAQRAGLSSTGMISYHFARKPELFAEVVNTILRAAGDITATRMRTAATYRAKLRAYIESNFEFIARHPAYTQALVEIVTGIRFRDTTSLGGLEKAVVSVDGLTDFLSEGRAAGEFGRFDSFTMAVSIRGAIDNFLRQHMFDGDLDIARHGREVADIFDLCTRPGAGASN
ncbi:TetR/AcrR family transcriptional regulator [Streptomyces sp. SL13]|uniref:TetR/AcrR family transcriptional regulator n=1 Tax=Streptantibioticus silvisoli TaxID=2705255 RepID=A0AA90GZU7_9ACTN|nr:TetR/AcrR family transcriptional regulator [Streptantibioticus silvisoli]MDI5963016.1 TetR/AcrR family transcriptional regulator [Streptantibioticus silvisoli]MDI5968731.1 TetR/AcrR family transcriptional regulator [Streptantibioticus silvisoli]